MAHQSLSEEHTNDRSNNTPDQQYKNWDIVKATQVVIIIIYLFNL